MSCGKFYTYAHLLKILNQMTEEELQNRFVCIDDDGNNFQPNFIRKNENGEYIIETAKNSKEKEGCIV